MMTAHNSTTHPGDVTSPFPQEPVESYTSVQEALVQAESSDWPSQPLSSMQRQYLFNPQLQDSLAYETDFSDIDEDSSELRHDNHSGYAMPTVHNNSQTTWMGNQQPQNPSTRASLLTRPTSSGEDLAAGFSFGKPPPTKLDLIRKKTSDTSGPTPNQGQEQRRQVQIQKHHNSPPNQEKANDAAASTGGNVPSQPKSASLKLHGPPFPIGGNESSSHNASKPETSAEVKESATSVQNEASFSADDTLVGSDVRGMNNTLTGDKLADGVLTSAYAPDEARPHVSQQNNLSEPSKGRPQPSAESHLRPKVRKSRKKPQPSLSAVQTANEEELMYLLHYKQQNAATERERLQEAFRSKDAELQETIQISNDLYTQLQDLSQRHSNTEAQLSQLKASKPVWESKLKKLSDFVKGLTNDHNRLRDDAKVIREGQDSVVNDKDALFTALREVCQATDRRNTRSAQLVTDARHDMKMFEQTIQHQQVKLQEEEALLVSERQKNKRLEEQISAFATSQEHMQDLFAGHREAITEKINDLLNKASNQVQATAPMSSHDDLMPMLEQCITLLKALTKSNGGVKTADFEKLEESMHKYFDGITRSVEACDHNTSMMESGHQQLAQSVQNELQALSSNIVTEHTLSEQIKDLREMRATVRERLHSTEVLLRDAKQEVLALQVEKKDHVRRITMLENDRGSRQPAVDPHMLLRIQETDTSNKELRKEQATLNAEVNSLGDQIRQKDENLQQLQTQLTESQAVIERTRDQATLIEQEKMDCEEQAVVEREQMRERLSQAASLELAGLHSDYQNAIKKLKAASSLDEKFQEAEKQLSVAQSEQKRLGEECATLKNRLDAMQNERQSEATLANSLRSRIAELESQAEERDGQFEYLQQQLLGEKDENRAKDGYIQAILEDNDKMREAHRSISVRPSDLSKPDPSHRLAVLEDSQDRGQPRFVSQSNIMGLGSQGSEPAELLDVEPQIEDDLSGLFPGTPQHLRTVEVTNVSYSQSRVTSRGKEVSSKGQPISPPNVRNSQQQSTSRHGTSVRPSKPTDKSTTSQRSNVTNQFNPAWSPAKAAQQQRETHGNASAPRGILKQTALDPRGQKRSVIDPDPQPSAAGFTASKRRRTSANTNGLGPIIGDSQSPMKGINGRARKQTTRHGVKNKRDERMLETFRGYTNNSQVNGS